MRIHPSAFLIDFRLGINCWFFLIILKKFLKLPCVKFFLLSPVICFRNSAFSFLRYVSNFSVLFRNLPLCFDLTSLENFRFSTALQETLLSLLFILFFIILYFYAIFFMNILALVQSTSYRLRFLLFISIFHLNFRWISGSSNASALIFAFLFLFAIYNLINWFLKLLWLENNLYGNQRL